MMRGGLRLVLMYMGILAFNHITYGEEYVLAFAKSRSNEEIQAVAGETGCWVKLRQGSEMSVLSYNTGTHFLSDSELTTNGNEHKSVVITVIGKDVSIYGAYIFSTFTPLPISALGIKYIVSSCHPPNDHSDYTLVLVIATHGHTTAVDITFRLEGNVTYQNKTYSDRDNLTLSLEKYQTFTIISDFDLTGTVVNSVHTVAVFSGTLYDDYIVAYDQLLPVQHYGQEYVVAVDDHFALYQLQIVSEHSGTKIMFNSGSRVSLGENGLHRQNLTQNSSLQFSSTEPVMATLCRGSIFSSGFVVIPPVALYTKQTILPYSRFKALSVDKGDPNVRNRSTSSIPGLWEKIPGTGYKVGTWNMVGDGSSVAEVSSITGFSIISFGGYSIYHGGYAFGPSSFYLDNTTSAAFNAISTSIKSTTSQPKASTTNTLVTNIPITNTAVDTTTRFSVITTHTTESSSKSTSHSDSIRSNSTRNKDTTATTPRITTTSNSAVFNPTSTPTKSLTTRDITTNTVVDTSEITGAINTSTETTSSSTTLTIVSAVCGVIIFLLLIIIVILVIYIKATRPPKSETTSNRVISNVTHTDFTNAHYEDAVPYDQGNVFQQDDQRVSRDTGNTYSDLSLYENSGDTNQYEKLHVYGN